MENNTFEYVVPCHFGMEAVLKREIMALGYSKQHIYNVTSDFFKKREITTCNQIEFCSV